MTVDSLGNPNQIRPRIIQGLFDPCQKSWSSGGLRDWPESRRSDATTRLLRLSFRIARHDYVGLFEQPAKSGDRYDAELPLGVVQARAEGGG